MYYLYKKKAGGGGASPAQNTVQFYPHTSDGFIEANNATYSTAQTASSGSVITGATIQFGQQKHSTSGYFVWRGFFSFDTSSIPVGATIDSAILKIYGTLKLDSGSVTPAAVVVSNSQASDTALVGDDFDQLGTTSFSTITYASYSTAGYNEFTLNASGLAQINPGGYSKFGLRTDKDIAGTAPPSNHTSQLYCSSVDETGTSQDPILEVTYTY